MARYDFPNMDQERLAGLGRSEFCHHSKNNDFETARRLQPLICLNVVNSS